MRQYKFYFLNSGDKPKLGIVPIIICFPKHLLEIQLRKHCLEICLWVWVF